MEENQLVSTESNEIELDDDKRMGDEAKIPDPQHSDVVASHYNNIKSDLIQRKESRIYYMRNFNNWIKSTLIAEYIQKIKSKMIVGDQIKVMDMCCGKGGDLLKWEKAGIKYLICTDIAELSIAECKERYEKMKDRSKWRDDYFKTEFITCDSTTKRHREVYADKLIKLNLVSCQFAFHYSFESLKQAECMFRNAAECLDTGGYFIGTIPDANDIIHRQRTSRSTEFGNEFYKIEFQCDPEDPPLFGAKYNFHLEGVVDCPEFLVYFPLFVKLARKFGLKLDMHSRFDEYFEEKIKSKDGKFLLQKLDALQLFSRSCANNEEFAHVRPGSMRCATLSKSEWEATTLYMVFAFKKLKTEFDNKGNPTYYDPEEVKTLI